MPRPSPVWICIDIETDGNCPGLNSMLSIGAVALSDDLREVGKYYATLKPIPGAKPDPQTTDWWKSQNPVVYRAARDGARDAKIVMSEFGAWVERHGDIPYAVMGPTGFDWPFVYYYFARFCGVKSSAEGGGITGNPFGFRTRDIRTMAADLLGAEKPKDKWPKRWRDPMMPHTHHALDDAMGLAFTFSMIQEEIRQMKRS